MTKKLEDEFNLPPIENIDPKDLEEKSKDNEVEEKTVEDSKREIENINNELAVSERVDIALPVVKGLDTLEREMDEYAKKAMETFEDLVDLGRNVEDRHAGPIFDSASKMLNGALQAKQAKIDKKLKMLELQQRQAKIELETRRTDAKVDVQDETVDIVDGQLMGDRTSLVNEIMSKIKEDDK
jgi:hypothetical protein